MAVIVDMGVVDGVRITVSEIITNTLPKQINDALIGSNITVDTMYGEPTVLVYIDVRVPINDNWTKHTFGIRMCLPEYAYDNEHVLEYFKRIVQDKIDSLLVKLVKAVISGDYSHVCDENNPFGG